MVESFILPTGSLIAQNRPTSFTTAYRVTNSITQDEYLRNFSYVLVDNSNPSKKCFIGLLGRQLASMFRDGRTFQVKTGSVITYEQWVSKEGRTSAYLRFWEEDQTGSTTYGYSWGNTNEMPLGTSSQDYGVYTQLAVVPTKGTGLTIHLGTFYCPYGLNEEGWYSIKMIAYPSNVTLEGTKLNQITSDPTFETTANADFKTLPLITWGSPFGSGGKSDTDNLYVSR